MSGSQPTPTPFGQLLRHWRHAAGLSQDALAARAGLSLRGVSDLERGIIRKARRETVQMLADALQLGPQARAAFEAAAHVATSPQNPRPMHHAPSRLGGVFLQVVGRRQEIARIERHLDVANNGEVVLLFTGEPGIGKSHLLHEAAERAAANGWCVVAGGCQRRGGQEPYAPLVGALAWHLAHQAPEHHRASLHGCTWLVRLLPELAETAQVPAPAWTLPPADEQRLVFAAVRRYLANVAGPAGTVLVLDDLQWAGSDALDLLAALVRTENEPPLRVVGAYRSTEVRSADPLAALLADLAREGLAAQVEVGPLATQEATALLDSLLEGSESIDAEWAAQVLQRAEGVPFFLLSCAQGLRTGALRQDTMGPDIPWNVSQTIRQRVAALPEAAQELLGAAAVIGRQAPRAILLAVMERGYGWGKREWLDAVERACQAGLLVEVGTEAYEFGHDLIREAVGASLSAARRALLHQEVADALEQLGEREREQHAAELAYHFSRTDQFQRAVQYSLQAADRAREAGARREEAALLGQALDAATRLEDHRLVMDLRVKRGQALNAAALWIDGSRELEAVLADLAPDQAEQRAAILVELASASYFSAQGLQSLEQARGYATEALSVAEELGRDDLAASAMCGIAVCDTNEGLVRESQVQFERAFARAGTDHMASLLNGLDQYGLNWYYLGHFQEADTHTRRALEIAKSMHDPAIITRTLGNLGMTLTARGRYDEALAIFDEARRCGQEYGTWAWLARAISMCAGLHLTVYDYAGAEALTEVAREVNRTVRFPNVTASTGIDLLLACARGHQAGQAERLLPDVRESVECVTKTAGSHAWLLRMRFAQAQAEVALARGAPHEALRFAEDGIAQARQCGRVKYEILGMQTHAQALAALGRTREAIIELHGAVEHARPVGDPSLFLRVATGLLAIEGDDALLADTRVTMDRMAAALPVDLRHIFLDAEPVRLVARLSR